MRTSLMRAQKSAAIADRGGHFVRKHLAQVLAAPPLDDDQTVPDDLIGRLYGANERAVADVMAAYTSDQRAYLAMFFYRKAHLRPIGLAIAATCDVSTLVQVWG